MTRYRIVKDAYAGYEVQIWRWWLPMWLQVGVNTFPSIERAEAWARNHTQPCVKYLGKLK